MKNRIITLMKWGEKYPCDDFNRVARALRHYSGTEFDITCVTDAPKGLSELITPIELPPIPIPREKWAPQMWPKISVFSKEMFKPDQTVIFLDVDIVLLGDITPLFEMVESQEGLMATPEWHPIGWVRKIPQKWRYDRGANTSVFGFKGGSQHHIWEKLHEYGEKATTSYRQEQKFVSHYADKLTYFPDPFCCSFKRHCVPFAPVTFFSKYPHPKGAHIVCFQGFPQIEEVATDKRYKRWWGQSGKFGIGPAEWVKEYYERFAE